MDNELDLQESQQPDEEINLDLELEPEDTAQMADETVEAYKQRIADLEAKNKRLYARLKKPATEKPKLTQKPEETDDLRKTVSELALAEKKRQYGYEHGLSPEETDKIFKINPNPTKETLEDEFIKAGLDALRAKRRVQEATPSPTSRSTSYKGKTFAQMDAQERAEFMEKRFS